MVINNILGKGEIDKVMKEINEARDKAIGIVADVTRGARVQNLGVVATKQLGLLKSKFRARWKLTLDLDYTWSSVNSGVHCQCSELPGSNGVGWWVCSIYETVLTHT